MFKKKNETNDRIEILENFMYDIQSEEMGSPEVGLRFECWDRAVATLSRDERVARLEDVLEWADQIYKFVNK